ncbi:MAG TPA: hypothetical protein PKJ41_17550 [Bryobacteraceae bacterium]|nr:hypothetical protein [Bryobacteraceae bacterium]
MKSPLLEQSVRIFDSLEKWNALFEIHGAAGDIMANWFEIGATALRRDFDQRPSTGWTCLEWENKQETKWVLTAWGDQSIHLGFGWPDWEYHLIFTAPAPFDEARARTLLHEPEFQPLAACFDQEEIASKGGKYRSLACDLRFNPFSGNRERDARKRELAWLAAHEPVRFVENMSSHVRQITDNPILSALVGELNRRTKTGVSQ